jgi:RNA-directed DNA polymerase
MTDNSSIDLSLTNIWQAWLAFRAGKKLSRAILEYEANLENNLINLCLALNNGSYRHGGYDHKILSDKKRRDIAVATVEDRVVHRLLYDFLVQKVDKCFDPDVWSGRKDKGLHKSLTRIASLADKYPDYYVWRADIEKFFDNVDHNILRNWLSRFVTDGKTKNLLDKVIDSYIHNGVSQGYQLAI